METIHYVIKKFIPKSTSCHKRIHFKHYYYCKRRKLKTIFNFNNLKWLRLQKKKKKRKNFLLWIIFIEVGITSWDFQGFPRSVWTNVFKRLSSNKQVNKLYFKHQKNSRKIQQIQEFKNHLITDLLAPRTWKKWPIEELDGNNT